ALHQSLRHEAVVIHAALDRHFDKPIVLRDGFHIRILAQQRHRTGGVVAYANLDDHADAGALHDVGNRAAVEKLALLDNADGVAQVGQLGKDVRRNQDRLSHAAKLFEQLAHFDSGARIKIAG